MEAWSPALGTCGEASRYGPFSVERVLTRLAAAEVTAAA